MWEAIGYISSGITLVAFIAAVIAWTLKSKLEERERLIRAASESDRGALVRDALESFHVETAGLTKEQQFQLSLRQIQARQQRFTISAAVICFLVIAAAGVTAYAVAQDTPPGGGPSRTPAAIDSALVGAWESVGAVENLEYQLRFQFGADGSYSRQYFKDDVGSFETTKDNIKSNNPSEGDWKYVLKSADSLVLSEGNNPSAFATMLTSGHGNSTDFKRVGVGEYPNDLLVGKWKTSMLIDGANFEWTIEIGRERNYRSHIEARDEGRFTAAGGTWTMITSNWSTSPISGSYKILSPASLRFNIYPFDSITLLRLK